MSRLFPSELELMILNVLWQAAADGESPMPVRLVRLKLAEAGRELAHTTVITTLNVMLDKKFVTRTPEKNSYLFRAKVTRESVGKKEVGKLLDRVFEGSAESLMQALLSAGDIDAESISQMKRMIAEASRKQSKRK